MKVVRAQIIEDGVNGLADVAVCECGSNLFQLAENIERMHVHFICGQCGTAFCPDSGCSSRPGEPIDGIEEP